MPTEDVSARYVDLDGWPTRDAVEAMYEAQLTAVAAVRPALGAIAAAADEAAQALHRGGRLVYAGAGTSGRVGVQDGAELPPTFDWPLDRLVFAMAGGQGALVKSAEGAEDDEAAAVRTMDEAAVGPFDVVLGIAASGTTPYTVAAVRRAAERGAVTIGIANNTGAPLLAAARHKILAETGAEVVAGSTRMKAGTAQKVVLNLLSTAIMIRLGRVYNGMMVHMHASNVKLHKRAAEMVMRITGCGHPTAVDALTRCAWDVKTAVLVVHGMAPDRATALLGREHGSLRAALAALPGWNQGSMLNPSRITVDASSPTPLYLQLAESIRAMIAAGAVRVGEALPSERELSAMTHISRVTVRKAIDTLLREGMLSRRPGSGTYVSTRIEQPASLLGGFSADMANRGSKPGSIWIEKALGVPTPEEAMTLAVGPDALVVRISRVRTADDEPLAIERAVVPATLLPPVEEIGDSLYAALGRSGNRPVRGLQRLQSSLATPAEAQLLNVPVGAAILRIERRSYLASGAPVEFTRSAYRGDRYDFVTEVRDPSIRTTEEGGR